MVLAVQAAGKGLVEVGDAEYGVGNHWFLAVLLASWLSCVRSLNYCYSK